MEFVIICQFIIPFSTWIIKSKSMSNKADVFGKETIRLIFRRKGIPQSTPHRRLMVKLIPHGMGNEIGNWIEQQLTDETGRKTR